MERMVGRDGRMRGREAKRKCMDRKPGGMEAV